MNIFFSDIVNTLEQKHCENQRELAALCGYSLGKINHTLTELTRIGFLDTGSLSITDYGHARMAKHRPQRAVILAAGRGLGMIPIHTEVPKALLSVHGQTLIERIIEQLHIAGITDITVVTGFMKERLEFLADAYHVDLVYNSKYASRNNLHSLYLVRNQLSDAYIIPCDIWFKENPFRPFEPCSWYATTGQVDEDSMVYLSKQRFIAPRLKNQEGVQMIGLSYITAQDAEHLKKNLEVMDSNPLCHSLFWESAVFAPPRPKKELHLYGRVLSPNAYEEINTFEQLRELDASSPQSESALLNVAAQALQTLPEKLTHIRTLKKGMTNRSFLFDFHNESYIMRIPGEGTDKLINRKEEADVYKLVSEHGLCEPLIYINPKNGYKITKFVRGTSNCDPCNENDVRCAMKYLRSFHDMQLHVSHKFDLYGQLLWYEKMRGDIPSVYDDYEQTKHDIFSLQSFIASCPKQWCLTHIDAVPDNFLMTKDRVYLIDWEYAGMQDPHVDIAMFAIYSLYDKAQTDRLIDLYFNGSPGQQTRLKIYCYVAICGLLWSNWCEYKRIKGVEFGEYSVRQYRYAKEYVRYFNKKEVPENDKKQTD